MVLPDFTSLSKALANVSKVIEYWSINDFSETFWKNSKSNSRHFFSNFFSSRPSRPYLWVSAEKNPKISLHQWKNKPTNRNKSYLVDHEKNLKRCNY